MLSVIEAGKDCIQVRIQGRVSDGKILFHEIPHKNHVYITVIHALHVYFNLHLPHRVHPYVPHYHY